MAGWANASPSFHRGLPPALTPHDEKADLPVGSSAGMSQSTPGFFLREREGPRLFGGSRAPEKRNRHSAQGTGEAGY